MKLTKDQVRKMMPGQVLSIACDSASELDSTYQVAMQARREIDAYNVAVSRSGKTMTVAIRVMEKGGER